MKKLIIVGVGMAIILAAFILRPNQTIETKMQVIEEVVTKDTELIAVPVQVITTSAAATNATNSVVVDQDAGTERVLASFGLTSRKTAKVSVNVK